MSEKKITTAALMGTLRACYPHRISDQEWAISLRRYTPALAGYSPEVVRRACDKAWKIYPQYFPTLGQLVDLCEAASREVEYRHYNPAQICDPEPTGNAQALDKIRKIIKDLENRHVFG